MTCAETCGDNEEYSYFDPFVYEAGRAVSASYTDIMNKGEEEHTCLNHPFWRLACHSPHSWSRITLVTRGWVRPRPTAAPTSYLEQPCRRICKKTHQGGAGGVLRHWTWRKTDPRRAASPALTSRTAVILGDGVTLSFLSCSLLLALSLSPLLSKTVEPPFPQRSIWDLILS